MRAQPLDLPRRRGRCAPRGRRSSSPGSAGARRRSRAAARRSRRCRRSRSAMCCTPEPKSSLRKRDDSVWRLCEALRTRRKRAVRRLDHLALHHAAGIDARPARGVFAHVEQRGVEQEPGQHLLVVHRLRDVVDARAGRRRRAGVASTGVELDVPEPAELALAVDEVDAGCRRARAPPGCRARPAPTACRKGWSRSARARSTVAARVVDAAAPSAQTDGPCVMLKEWAKPSFSVLTTRLMSPCRQRVTAFDLCRPALAKPRPRSTLSKRRRRGLVHRELDELDAGAARARRQVGQRRRPARRSRGAARRAGRCSERCPSIATLRAEPARKRSLKISSESEPVVAGRLQRLHEVADRQLALARESSGSAGSRTGSPSRAAARRRSARGRCGRAGSRGWRRGRCRAPSDVEGVEHEADGRMVGAPHHLPGVAVVVDVAAPGERLEADAQAALRRALAELAEVGRGAVDAAERLRRDVAADQQEVAAELLHDVELALGAREDLRALRLGHALEVAERLEGDDRQAEIVDQRAAPPRGVPLKERRSFSKISTPLKRAAAIASSFSFSVPLRRDGGDRGLHGAFLKSSPASRGRMARWCVLRGSRFRASTSG